MCFWGQFVNDKSERGDTVMLVKSFSRPVSVIAEVMFDCVTEEISDKCFKNVFPVVITDIPENLKPGVSNYIDGVLQFRLFAVCEFCNLF